VHDRALGPAGRNRGGQIVALRIAETPGAGDTRGRARRGGTASSPRGHRATSSRSRRCLPQDRLPRERRTLIRSNAIHAPRLHGHTPQLEAALTSSAALAIAMPCLASMDQAAVDLLIAVRPGLADLAHRPPSGFDGPNIASAASISRRLACVYYARIILTSESLGCIPWRPIRRCHPDMRSSSRPHGCGRAISRQLNGATEVYLASLFAGAADPTDRTPARTSAVSCCTSRPSVASPRRALLVRSRQWAPAGSFNACS